MKHRLSLIFYMTAGVVALFCVVDIYHLQQIIVEEQLHPAEHSVSIVAALKQSIFLNIATLAVLFFLAGAVYHPLYSRMQQYVQQAALLNTVITSASDGVVITDADLTAPGPRILYVNEAFTRITGYKLAEVKGKSPRFLQGEGTDRATLIRLRETLERGEPFKAEILNYTKTGASYWLGLSIVPVRDGDGRITNFAAIERDITAEKEAEATLQKTLQQAKRANLRAEAAARDLEENLQQAHAANQAKSDFLANMSHELRTPMNGVLGMTHLLAETQLSNEQLGYIYAITSSAETLLVLLNDILDVSKIEAGALKLENIPFALPDVVRDTVTLLRPQGVAKGFDVLATISPDVPDLIWGDSARFRQILTNLVGNAIKFTEKGYVHTHVKVEGGNLIVQVEDTGIGIPPEKLEKIFEKFTQADATITRKYGGTGLGLTITRELVHLMHGTIHVQSHVGRGSVFQFSIPLRTASEADVMANSQPGGIFMFTDDCKPVAETKVLLAEDYPVNQVFAKKLLTKFGFVHIDLAENGLEVLERMKKTTYDCIFMDCQMPEMDGYEATRQIRVQEAGTNTHIPIIAMTANAMVGDREKCIAAGMNEYVSKPLNPNTLKTILQLYFTFPDTLHTAQKKTETPPEDVPVDLTQLRLFTDGNRAEEQELFTLFLQQADEAVKILEKNQSPETAELWKATAHRLKGASGNLGAQKLQHLCKRAELMARDDTDKKSLTFNAIHAELQRVRDYLARA